MSNLPYQPTAVIATKSQPPSFVGSNDHQQQQQKLAAAKQDPSGSQNNTGKKIFCSYVKLSKRTQK